MGQRVSQPDQEAERLQELGALLSQAIRLQLRCDPAVYDAVSDYVARLRAEELAIAARIGGWGGAQCSFSRWLFDISCLGPL